MKVKIVFLFTFMIVAFTVAFTNLAYSTPYFGYSSLGGTWYDANKTKSNTLDDAFCTTAAASNVLMYTGWNAGFSSSGAIFTGFLNTWASSSIGRYLNVSNSWSLWLNGTYTIWPSPTPIVDSSGSGKFYSNNPFATYYHTDTKQSNVLSAADTFLHAGDGVTLTIQSQTLRGAQHTVTLWGYEYDNNGNYLGLYITDSDDYMKSVDPDNPTPTLAYYPVTWNASTQNWWLNTYTIDWLPSWGTGFFLAGVQALEQYPVPEPSTMLLFGSGLLGLVGYGRKKFFKK